VEKENILECKIDSLIRRLEKMEIEKKEAQDLKAAEERSTCEECGEYGHVHKDCPEEAKVLYYMRNGDLPNFRYGQGRPQFNASSSISNSVPLRIQLKYFMDEQAKINKDTITKFKAIDKVLENIDSKVTEVGSSNHQVLNMMKMLETQVGQLVRRLTTNERKLPGQPKGLESVKAIQTRSGKETEDPECSAGERKPKPSTEVEEFAKEEVTGSSPKSPSLRCRERTRRYRNSSHATSKVNLTTTLRSLWRLCVDLASTCCYWTPFKFLHILVTSKTYLQINMR
jgi:hypothetical protein